VIDKSLKKTFQRIFDPLPIHQTTIGFNPNFYIKLLRYISRLLIMIFGLHGRSRFSNEFIQMLDPKIEMMVSGVGRIVLRTGHGRLLWRAKTIETEEPMMGRWLATFTDKDCFYDVGANIGSYSIIAAKKGARVFSFEAEINNLQLLYENAFLNDVIENIMPIHIALHDETAIQNFFVRSFSKGDALHSISRPSIYLENFKGFKISTLSMRLDDIIDTFGLPYPTRLKIDVDTNELNILKGANRALEICKEVYIELYLNFQEHQVILDFMKDKGFKPVDQEKDYRPFMEGMVNVLFRKQNSSDS